MQHAGRRLCGALFLMLSLAVPTVCRAQTAKQPCTTGPTIAGCPLLPADNVWNARIDKLKLDPRSQDYVVSIGTDKPLHPDFGADPSNGMPVTVIDSKVKYIKVNFAYADQSDLGNYPIPPNALIEGGPNAKGTDGDRHVLLVDKDRCLLMELFGADKQTDTFWKAGSGIKVDLTSNALRTDSQTSADAAGLFIVPGLVRYDEVAAGEIRHALRFTAPHAQHAYVWPARHMASSNTSAKLPPMGQRFRLRQDFDISGFSKTNQVILTALKRYGMFLADNGSAWFLSGSPDPRWNDDDLHNLTQVKGSDFEAVDESDWQFLGDSARVDPASGQ